MNLLAKCLHTTGLNLLAFLYLFGHASDLALENGGPVEVVPHSHEHHDHHHPSPELLQQLQFFRPASAFSNQSPTFTIPLKKNPNWWGQEAVYWSISNYVDHNAAYPNKLLDYNNGQRSYDLSNGYNHSGTDWFTFPYSWAMMDQRAVAVIAAAGGIISHKFDGNYDKQTGFGSGNWNAVYITHADGSVAWYGHLANGSLTTKNVGESVSQGEFLGYIGSSGNSTGPHLHFEVRNAEGEVLDPYAGPAHSGESMWESQPDYVQPRLLEVWTHSLDPSDDLLNGDPHSQSMHRSINFTAGRVYLYCYFRDISSGDSFNRKVYYPDGSLYANWDSSFTNSSLYYSAYWWSWIDLDNASEIKRTGKWRVVTTMDDRVIEREFFVGRHRQIELTISQNNLPLPSTPVLIGRPGTDLVSSGNGYRTPEIIASTHDAIIRFEDGNSDG